MKNIKKSVLISFNNKVKSYVLNNGGKVTTENENRIELTLYTDAGILLITLFNEQSLIASIYCRFLTVEDANILLSDNTRLNRYSGKFNFHYSDVDTCFFVFTNEMEAVLSKEPILF